MTESREPSYYEIALTNRQVLVAFVLLLACVVIAFFTGVWVGRDGEAAPEEIDEIVARPEAGETTAAPAGELEEFNFFSEEEGEGGEAAADPQAVEAGEAADLEDLATEPRPDTTLSQDLGVDDEQAGESTAGPEAATEEPPPPRPAPSEERAAPAAEPAEAESDQAAGPVVIQVFSSPDGEHARRIMERLRAGGYRAFLSPVNVAGSTMHRVRVGPYPDRGDAQTAAAEIKKSYKLDTWITAGG